MTHAPLPPNLTLAIADDHPMIRLAIQDVLLPLRAQEVVMCQSGKELLEALECRRFDLVVTDFAMEREQGSEDGLRLIQRIRSRFPETPVVVFTMLTNPGLLSCIQAEGVAAIVGKTEDPEVLRRTCLDVISGLSVGHLSAAIAGRIANAGGRSDARTSQLSPKEIEVVRLFASGDSLTRIAAGFHRSLATIAAQKRSAMKKLNISNNADLIAYARDNGLA